LIGPSDAANRNGGDYLGRLPHSFQAPSLRGYAAEEKVMSVARVTEIISSSEKSFDDAVEKGIKRAAKTLKNVEGAWIKEQKVIVKNGKIAEYRVDLKVTFILID
jgi:dodecin